MKPNEEPIKLYIYPFGALECPVSHAALSYGEQVIDFGSKGFFKNVRKNDGCYIYNIYPSEAGIDAKKLQKAIEKRQKQIKGNDYNYLTENCADQVFAVLKEAGAKDLDKTLGIAIPKLDGVNSLDDWAEKHGHLVQTPNQDNIHTNLRHLINGINNKEHPKKAKFSEDMAKIRAAAYALTSPQKCRNMLKGIYERTCKRKKSNFIDKINARREYLDNYIYTQLPAEEVVRQMVAIINEYPEGSTQRQQLVRITSIRIGEANRKGILSDKLKDMLEQAGYNPSLLGRSEKKIQDSKPNTKPNTQVSPTLNIYQNTGHTA